MDTSALEYLLKITSDGCMGTALYRHKETKEAYIVVSSLEQRGGGSFDRIHSITKASLSDVDLIMSIKEEYTYDLAWNLRRTILNFDKMGKRFWIEGQEFIYMVYLLVDGVRINARDTLLSEDMVQVPSKYFPSKKYEMYHVAPGPFEHAFDLPAGLIERVITQIEKL